MEANTVQGENVKKNVQLSEFQQHHHGASSEKKKELTTELGRKLCHRHILKIKVSIKGTTLGGKETQPGKEMSEKFVRTGDDREHVQMNASGLSKESCERFGEPGGGRRF